MYFTMIQGRLAIVLRKKVQKTAFRLERKKLKTHRRKLPQFTTMNVIEGQAIQKKKC